MSSSWSFSWKILLFLPPFIVAVTMLLISDNCTDGNGLFFPKFSWLSFITTIDCGVDAIISGDDSFIGGVGIVVVFGVEIVAVIGIFAFAVGKVIDVGIVGGVEFVVGVAIVFDLDVCGIIAFSIRIIFFGVGVVGVGVVADTEDEYDGVDTFVGVDVGIVVVALFVFGVSSVNGFSVWIVVSDVGFNNSCCFSKIW